MNTNDVVLAPAAAAGLMRELRTLTKRPPEGIRVRFSEEKMNVIESDIEGPTDTPFEGGLFRIKLVLSSNYPRAPPKGFFLTKIFHPNVADGTGEICVDTLKRDWDASHGLSHVLMVIRCLLIVPNPDSALNPDAGSLIQDDFDDFARRARMMTRLYAKPEVAEDAENVKPAAPAAAAAEADPDAAKAKVAKKRRTAAAAKKKKKAGLKRL